MHACLFLAFNYISVFYIYLSDGIEENKDEVDQVAEPEDGLVDIEWVIHVAVDQTRCVDKCHQRELLLL